MTGEKKGPSLQRYQYLYDKLSEIAEEENHDNLIPALTGLLCQVVADSGHDKKYFLSYLADTLDREFEENKEDGRQH